MRTITILLAALLLGGCAAGSGRQGTEVVVRGVGPTAPVAAGSTATFVMTVTNTGPADASNIKLVDNVGNGLQLQSITCAASGGATCPSPTSVEMVVSYLPNGGTLTFDVNVQLDQNATGTVSNSMSATFSEEIDSTQASAAVTATAMSTVTNIVVTGQGPTAPVVGGSTAVFVMTVTNNGPDAATAFNVHDTIGNGLSLLSITCAASGGATCPATISVLTPITTLPSGGVLTFTVTTRVAQNAVGTVSNGTSVDVKTNPNPSANTAYATATVVTAGLNVVGQAPTGPLADGASGAFTMTVINTGPATANNLFITNTLSAGITETGTALGCAASGGAICPSALTPPISIPSLVDGGTLTFTVPFTVNAGTNGQVGDTMTVTSSTNPEGNVATAVVGAGSSSLVVSETGDPQVSAGGTAVFTAIVANTGTTAATNFAVTYTLSGPAGSVATIACATSGSGAVCPATLGQSMTAPLLDPGQTITFTFSVPVPASAAGQGPITNIVTVSGSAGNYEASFSTIPLNANNGNYTVFAADGNQYQMSIDFDAGTYRITGSNGVDITASFAEDPTGGGYSVSCTTNPCTRKLRVYTNLIVGGEDFSGTGTVVPYIAARVFASSLSELAQFFGGLYDVATLETATGTTGAGTARVTGNVLDVCQQAVATQNCPVSSLESYSLSINGDVITGTSTSNSSAPPFTFQLAIIGASSAMLSNPQGGSSPELLVGLPDGPALAGGTSYGASTTGDWVTVALMPCTAQCSSATDSFEYDYTGVIDTAGASASLALLNATGGPFSMLAGYVGTNTSPVYVMQAYPLAVAFGACSSGNSTCMQVTIP